MTDPYASGVLREERHSRLVADIDRYAREAGIHKQWIWTPLSKSVTQQEVDWVTCFPRHSDELHAGLMLMGSKPKIPVELRMAAIAGTLTRNFIFAKVMTASQVIDATVDKDPPMMSCLLVPNFFVGKGKGGDIPSWRLTALYDLLLSRNSANLQTVVYVSDWETMTAEYGDAIANHLGTFYVKVTA